MNKKIIYGISIFLWAVLFITLFSNSGISTDNTSITGATIFSIKNNAPIPLSFLIISLLVITNAISLYFFVRNK